MEDSLRGRTVSGVLVGRGGARIGCGGEGRTLVVEVVWLVGRRGGDVRGEMNVVRGKGQLLVESVVEEGGIVGCVGEVVPVKV